MKVKTLAIAAITVSLITACAGTPEGGSKTAANQKGKICKYEKTTGSHIGTKICRTPEQIQREKENAQQAMKTLTRGQTKSGQ
ncbi:hypothetical protein RI845_05905 [Thalassotalea nanhaiensis]|uniref:Lipoprotein n=1 Tax=Thalassotalea nanhaiensis TaxID=3065648 RepID=A0ABY9TPL8_9GAMM|nr:hypothetical protein RI845_05905 [Colwelliaceae bacterium SQ345]